ncbi:MAG: 2-dehydropantoate 2-reductase [Burkholderiaceae bacterium]|jgi:2-dehydropantoate 2-reductase
MDSRDIVVAGAGSIGCFVGGLLQAAGTPIRFLGRPNVVEQLTEYGLTLSDCDGGKAVVPGASVRSGSEPEAVAKAGIILVTVKCGATAEIARSIAPFTPEDAIVISLQNGVGNVDVLKAELPGRRVFAGMVPFNVVQLGHGRYHRATGGAIALDAKVSDFAAALRSSGLSCLEYADMSPVAWGKLLLNLNNGLNALSGLPLAEELALRSWRLVLAQCIDEALTALRRAGIKPAQAGPIAPGLLPYLLRCPDFLYHRIARKQLQIDPLARSSMWDDLEKGRSTEIDYLQGAVVALADRVGSRASMNVRVRDLVHEAERAQRRPGGVLPGDIVDGVRAKRAG